MPASTPRLALPYPVPADTADVPRDIQALATKVDGLNLPLSAFPASPVDGQEVLIDAPGGGAASPSVWRFVYRAAGGMWLFLGGADLAATVASGASLTNGAGYAAVAGLSITMPLQVFGEPFFKVSMLAAGGTQTIVQAKVMSGATQVAAAEAGLSASGDRLDWTVLDTGVIPSGVMTLQLQCVLGGPVTIGRTTLGARVLRA